MAELPRGIVVFLFTDVEGSAHLWERDRAAMQEAASLHDALLAEAIAAHGGVLYKHIGDAVQAAFATAREALAAAVDAQQVLATARWPEIGPLQVRMALHAGEAEPDASGDYHQVASLNRLSRLLESGHGGQILLTDAVRRLLDGRLPASVTLSVTLKDLGEHRLRGLLEPERVWQAVAPNLPADFPSLRSPKRLAISLSTRLTPLIGRDREVTVLDQLLNQDGVRLVTLHGPGGVGKSRLGYEAASTRLKQLRDGAIVVDLGLVTDPSRVLPSIADALDIREETGVPIEDTLSRRLAEREQLLVLDTAEHVVDQVAPLVAKILGVSPAIQFLVTSRETLRIHREHVYEVGPLELPAPQGTPYSADAITETGSVALFVDRARAVAPDFGLDDANASAIAEICRRLDGLPLAIELAAAWMDTLSANKLLDRLRPRLPMLVDGPRDLPQRQQTMRDAIDWSYDLLDATQQQLFRVVATFVGDFGTIAAEAVAQPFGMAGTEVVRDLRALRRKSLISRSLAVTNGDRFRMLDTIREFALGERDAQGQKDRAEQAHAHYFEDWLVALATPLEGTPTREWLDALDAEYSAEYSNVRAALEWARLHGEDRVLMRLAWVLWRFWGSRGYFSEGRYWLARAIETSGVADPLIYPDLLVGAGELARMQGDYPEALAFFEEAARVARATGITIQEASALLAQGTGHYDQGAFDDAIEDWKHARRLFDRLTGDEAELGRAKADAGLGDVALDRNNLARARELLEPACDIFRRPGKAGDTAALASSLGQLARLAHAEGRLEDARELINESLEILTALGDARGYSHQLLVAASIAQALGDTPTAVRFRAGSRELALLLGSRQRVALAQHEQARANPGLTNEERKALVRDSIATFHDIGETHGVVESAELFAALMSEEHPRLSAELFGTADALRRRLKHGRLGLAELAYQAMIDALRATLGEQFEVAWQTGQDFDTDRIVNQVLSERPQDES
jgi:predicted ATPase/class 3 adenylate cyclase